MKKILFILFAAIFISAMSYQDKKPYTIMIYMNGSDLESEFGAATTDLVEILDSGLHSKNAAVLILTGGTKKWQNDAIPETEVILWEFADGYLYEKENFGKVNMGNPDTLQDFIMYGLNNYPAHKFGLIMWDHGGGSIAGFGHDEKFDDDYLSLLEMKQAFEKAGLRKNKLEFLGFDACLMATVEMAVIAADYAKVFIAAEDLEPGDGWDYGFLGYLNENPHMDGFELGEIIVDTFIDFFGMDSDEILTLSVVDLAKVKPVMDSVGKLMAKARVSSSIKIFQDVAKRRSNTKTFGEGSPRDNYADMVDIGDMALNLYDLFPDEAEEVLETLKNAVVYNRFNSDVELFGLSTFYIYGGKSIGESSLNTYDDLNMDEDYTNFLFNFFDGLISNKDFAEIIKTELVLWQPREENVYRMKGLLQTKEKNNFLWPSLDEHPVALFPIAKTENFRLYAIPAEVNKNEADIVVLFSQRFNTGKILGLRYTTGGVWQKGYDPINKNDEIAIYYIEKDFSSGNTSWVKGEHFKINTLPHLTWKPALPSFKQGFRHHDVYNNILYDTLTN